MAQYIGSRATLITKSQIRYEGVLYSVNEQEGSLGLKNVRVFGTEDREVSGPAIAPASRIFEYVVFQAKDILKLEFVKAEPESIPDPAIMSQGPSKPASTGGNSRVNAWGQRSRHDDVDHVSDWRSAPRQEHRGHRDSGRGRRGGGGGGRGGGSSRAGDGSHLRGRRERGVDTSIQPEEVKGEFDFESSNARFDKESEFQKMVGTEGADDTAAAMPQETLPAAAAAVAEGDAKPAYDKGSSFFDTLSSDHMDKRAGRNTRVDHGKLRQMNVETFGAESLKSGGGAGGGHHYGGRGGGRGGGYGSNRQRQYGDGQRSNYGRSHRGGGSGGGRGGRGGGRRQGGGRQTYGSGDPSKD